jgi:hypothetical protein
MESGRYNGWILRPAPRRANRYFEECATYLVDVQWRRMHLADIQRVGSVTHRWKRDYRSTMSRSCDQWYRSVTHTLSLRCVLGRGLPCIVAKESGRSVVRISLGVGHIQRINTTRSTHRARPLSTSYATNLRCHWPHTSQRRGMCLSTMPRVEVPIEPVSSAISHLNDKVRATLFDTTSHSSDSLYIGSFSSLP